MSRFRVFLLAAYAAVVSSHSEDVSPTESSLCTKFKSWIASILSDFAMTKNKYINPNSLCHSEPLVDRIQLIIKSMSEKKCFKSLKEFFIFCERNSKGCIALAMTKYAFTLAEVLVTLGIIGVVSAMTVPSLMQNYQRQSYVTQLHKVYNETSQAVLKYQTDRNALNLKEAGLTSLDAVDKWVKSYFKVIKDCANVGSDCFAVGEYKKMNGSHMNNIFDQSSGYRYYVLASGAAISVYPFGDGKVAICVDINSKKGPNIIGRDTFALMIYDNGYIDDSDARHTYQAPLTKEQRELSYTSYCNVTTGAWWGCFGKILNDGWQMTY